MISHRLRAGQWLVAEARSLAALERSRGALHVAFRALIPALIKLAYVAAKVFAGVVMKRPHDATLQEPEDELGDFSCVKTWLWRRRNRRQSLAHRNAR